MVTDGDHQVAMAKVTSGLEEGTPSLQLVMLPVYGCSPTRIARGGKDLGNLSKEEKNSKKGEGSVKHLKHPKECGAVPSRQQLFLLLSLFLQVSQDFPFLHPSETCVLNRLCRLGTDHMRFTEFIDQYTGHVQQQDHHPSQQGQGGLHGTYLRAFCTGSDSVLQPHRQALLDLEQEFLADPHLSISHVNYSLGQFQLLFPSVMVVVEQIKSQKVSTSHFPFALLSTNEILIINVVLQFTLEEESAFLQFSLRVEILPSYIPVRVAEKILFVGESIQMFENQNVNLTRKGSILKNQEDTFAAELHRLKQQPLFSLVDFEQVVDGIRSTVAEHLWKLMVEESDLLGQLKIIKDFYLLGRGELFQAFIDTAQHMLKTPATAGTEHDVNVAFQQSAHKVLLDDDNLLPLLHLTIEYHGKEHKVSRF
ncbi:gamma-tubulin complex component 4-like [Castor canadensis]|uniref:Gamma-tubulin complex component 4-like n=1 Tax=Castor canadensis TaxID=51338 RepID=A0AC58KQA3_CASCN